MPPKSNKTCQEGYCVKCKKMQMMTECKKATTSNNRNVLQGKCKTCGTKMNKFIKG